MAHEVRPATMPPAASPAAQQPGQQSDDQPRTSPTAPTLRSIVPSASSPSATPSPTVSIPVTGPGTFGTPPDRDRCSAQPARCAASASRSRTGSARTPTRSPPRSTRILGDPRSWIASGKLRLQRVPAVGRRRLHDLPGHARPRPSGCAPRAGCDTEGYTSCRLPGQVIINLARWLNAVPGLRRPARGLPDVRDQPRGRPRARRTATRRAPARGEPAPVMQQQTYGLKGCVANAWPYVDGAAVRRPSRIPGS